MGSRPVLIKTPRAAIWEVVIVISVIAISLGCASAELARRDVDEYPPKETVAASVLRGDIAFQNYCSLCHGTHADGRGRAARLYNPKPANLTASFLTDQSKESIIRMGGKSVGRSQFMPPWGEELTDEQITDIVRFLRSIAPMNAPK